jgi:poly-gamma-glutamate synthesis protein (capsule biosynthesis protein)
MTDRRTSRSLPGLAAAALVALAAPLAACATPAAGGGTSPVVKEERATNAVDIPAVQVRRQGTLTLAFAGDVHFEWPITPLLDHPRGALGRIARTLRRADVAMANLETSITSRGTRLHMDYAFRTSPIALDVLADAGIDVVTMANNHAVDYGPVGLRDTLRAVRRSAVPVVGIGRDVREAFRAYRVTTHGTRIAFLAASSEPDQLARSAAGPSKAGIATARAADPRRLVRAVQEAARRNDVVVVYLHWGTELETCPTREQRVTARALAAAGADVLVGSHAHVLLGAGWLDHTFVDYGLGNFVWYHGRQPDSGVLQVQVRNGSVVGGSWDPARIGLAGGPARPVHGERRTAAIADWKRLRGCTDLAPRPGAQ